MPKVIFRILWGDTLQAWLQARLAIHDTRNRSVAAQHLVIAHNALSGMKIRFTSEVTEVNGFTPEFVATRQASLRQLLLGCIGEPEGLSDIKDLQEAFRLINETFDDGKESCL